MPQLSRIAGRLRDEIVCRRDPVAFHRRKGVVIGSGVELIAPGPLMFGSEPYLVRIGNDVTISNDVQFVTHDGGLRVIRREYPGAFLYAPIVVGDGAFIGARAMLLPGVTVGQGAVVGVGAIVTKAVPDHTVVAGIPAREIKPVADYAFVRRSEWVDTAGLSAAEKERVLRAHFQLDSEHGPQAPGS